jgi:hypothetical protein
MQGVVRRFHAIGSFQTAGGLSPLYAASPSQDTGYITEDSSAFYVAEDGATVYVPETGGGAAPGTPDAQPLGVP